MLLILQQFMQDIVKIESDDMYNACHYQLEQCGQLVMAGSEVLYRSDHVYLSQVSHAGLMLQLVTSQD